MWPDESYGDGEGNPYALFTLKQISNNVQYRVVLIVRIHEKIDVNYHWRIFWK